MDLSRAIWMMTLVVGCIFKKLCGRKDGKVSIETLRAAMSDMSTDVKERQWSSEYELGNAGSRAKQRRGDDPL